MAQNEDVKTVNEAAKGASVPTDSVLAVSRHADGTPAQTPGFTSVHPESTEAISKNQLRELHASAADHEIRQAMVAGAAGDTEPHEDPVNKALREAIEKAGDAGEKKAEGEKVKG